MNLKVLFIPALAVLVACSGSQGKKATASSSPAPAVVHNVEVAAVQVRDVPQESIYASTVEAFAVNNIMPQTGGRIRKINAEVGDYVTKGQVLAEMDRLQMDQLALQVKNDEDEYARLKTLYEQRPPNLDTRCESPTTRT